MGKGGCALQENVGATWEKKNGCMFGQANTKLGQEKSVKSEGEYLFKRVRTP